MLVFQIQAWDFALPRKKNFTNSGKEKGNENFTLSLVDLFSVIKSTSAVKIEKNSLQMTQLPCFPLDALFATHNLHLDGYLITSGGSILNEFVVFHYTIQLTFRVFLGMAETIHKTWEISL
jgi:hypothetical protein